MRIRGAGPPPRPRKDGENNNVRADARIYSERPPHEITCLYGFQFMSDFYVRLFHFE